jgi:4-hydroxy-tetrahydrodipicolinate synthase
MSSFRGIWIALVTPFHDTEVDFDGLGKLIDKLLPSGIAGFAICGTTGEAAALSQHEQLAILDAVLERVPPHQVMMGLAGNNLRDLLAFQQEIQTRDIAALLVSAPYYIRPSQEGLVSFFHQIADAATVPIVVYDIPYRTAVRIELETLRRIAHHPRIAAVKDCSGDIETTMKLISEGKVEVLAGEDLQIFANLCLGGAGAISASANIRPDLYVRLQRQVESGRLAEARKTLYHLLPWLQIAFTEPNPGPVKTAVALSGIIRKELREPMQSCTPQTSERIREILLELAQQPPVKEPTPAFNSQNPIDKSGKCKVRKNNSQMVTNKI